MAGFPHAGVRETPLAGYRPTVASQSAAKNYFNQGTSFLREGRSADAEACLREALRLAPDDPDILNNLGTAIWKQGRTAECSAYYLRAHQYKPRDFGILNNLGIALWDQGQPQRAAVFYRRALELRPDSFDTQMNLGVSLSDLGQFDEALHWIRSSMQLQPNSADAWDNLGMTLARQGHWHEAMACYDRAIELRPDFGEAHRNRALGWLAEGDFERGWPESEWRLKCRNPPGFGWPRPRWNGEDLGGQTILLHWEQGLGDTLQFIRFAPLVKQRGGQVWVFCQPSLVRLVALCPGVDRAFGSSPLPDFPVHAPLMSVPAILGTTLASLPGAPYLFADAATIEQWRLVLRRALGVADLTSVFKIGIAWQGNPQNRVDLWRSFPLKQLAPLAELAGVRLISLQKGPGTEQVRALDRQFPVVELDSGIAGLEDRRDFLDTAAVISLLDLVVTPETAVAHLAGSLGVPTWVALSSVGDWRWMNDGDDSPWYANTRLFRQATMGDWDGVFRRMADSLQREIMKKSNSPE
jgi:Flp pilus assembly protein TadD